MKKFSKITGEKIPDTPKNTEVNQSDIDKLRGGIMRLMDNYLAVQMYGPITRYHVAGTMKVAGKEMFMEALIDMLSELTNNSKVKMLEGMKSESNDWRLIDSKIDELKNISGNISESKLVNHKEKVKSIYNRYKNNQDQVDRYILKVTNPETAYLRSIAAGSMATDTFMKKISEKYLLRAKQLESYTFEDFTSSDMEFVKDLWQDGFSELYSGDKEKTINQLSIESNLDVDTVKQILDTLSGKGDIDGYIS